MVNLVRRLLLLMQRGDGARDIVHRNDIDAIGRAEGKCGKSGEEDEGANHFELVRFRAPAVAEHDARTKYRARNIREQLADHVLAEFLGPGVRVVVRAAPIDRCVFRDDLIRSMASDGDGTDVAEAPQAVLVTGASRKLDHFERPPKIYVQAAFFRLPIDRSGAMNDGVGAADQLAVLVVRKAKIWFGQVTQKYLDTRI